MAETVHIDGVAAPLFGNEAAVGELLHHLFRIGFGPVDLVDGYENRHAGCLGVVDGLKGLRHRTVIGRNHDDGKIGDLGSAGTHAGKGFVTRGIEEDDLAAGGRRAFLGELHLVGADVLGDAAGFAGGNVGFADGVEQRGLTVIDVAHDGDHRRARHFELVDVVAFQDLFDGLVGEFIFVADDGSASAEARSDILDHLRIERLVHGDEDAAHEQGRDQILGANF